MISNASLSLATIVKAEDVDEKSVSLKDTGISKQQQSNATSSGSQLELLPPSHTDHSIARSKLRKDTESSSIKKKQARSSSKDAAAAAASSKPLKGGNSTNGSPIKKSKRGERERSIVLSTRDHSLVISKLDYSSSFDNPAASLSKKHPSQPQPQAQQQQQAIQKNAAGSKQSIQRKKSSVTNTVKEMPLNPFDFIWDNQQQQHGQLQQQQQHHGGQHNDATQSSMLMPVKSEEVEERERATCLRAISQELMGGREKTTLSSDATTTTLVNETTSVVGGDRQNKVMNETINIAEPSLALVKAAAAKKASRSSRQRRDDSTSLEKTTSPSKKSNASTSAAAKTSVNTPTSTPTPTLMGPATTSQLLASKDNNDEQLQQLQQQQQAVVVDNGEMRQQADIDGDKTDRATDATTTAANMEAFLAFEDKATLMADALPLPAAEDVTSAVDMVTHEVLTIEPEKRQQAAAATAVEVADLI